MDEDKVTDLPTIFRGICRACMKKNRELFPLFGGAKIKFGEKCFTISEILFLGGRVKTSPEDKLPKHVCRKCLTRLIEIFSFQLKCIETDIKLKNTLNKQIITLKTEPNNLISSPLDKETEFVKELALKTEKLDSSLVGFSEIDLKKSSENYELELSDCTNNGAGNKSSISDIVVSILEDKEKQVSVSMTVTLNDKNQSHQQQENRCSQEIRSIQEKEDYINLKDSCNKSSSQLSNEIFETFPSKNKVLQHNQDNDKGQSKFICTFCKNCFDTWSDLGKHIVQHKIQNNYGHLRSESPKFDVSLEENLKDKNEYSEELTSQRDFDIDLQNLEKNTSDINAESSQLNDIKLNVLSEQEMPILTPYPQVSVEQRFYCSYCPAHYKYKQNVKKHTRKKHKSELSKESYSCSICHKKFKQYLEVARHRRRYHTKSVNDVIQQNVVSHNGNQTINITRTEKEPEKNITRTNAETEPAEKDGKNADSHLKSNSDNLMINGRFYCIYCPSHYARRADFGTHLKMKHNKKLSYVESKQKAAHNSVEKRASVWKCRQCPATFFDQKSLIVHEEKHDKSPSKPVRKLDNKIDEPAYNCKICGDTFLTLFSWNSHNFTKHNSNLNNIFECENCGKTFLRLSSLKNHIKTHKKIIIVNTDTNVNRKLSTSTDVESESTQNTSSSSSNKPLNCSDIENIDQAHKCLICPSIFDNRNSLRKHTRTRHRDKLKEYEQQRTNNHLFQCLGCYKWFFGNSHLKVHTKRHIVARKGMKINCDICHKNFNNIKGYGKHLTSHRAAAQRNNRYLFS
ncbi:zinc finger protein 33B-like isoform X2 [Condylostylus longicornis]|uniref:zinc finger protein 33B-like isoform X2 n=1 Tax=Condylostylus longicornis TaxID=2530218 RepID=UPI00244E5A04|nr:zinc finger protein 33B-like isoform X2 [Condylostylus longicornis]